MFAIVALPGGAEAQTRFDPGALTFMPPQTPLDARGEPRWSASTPVFQVTNRPCEGCPPRRVWRSVFQTTWVNVAYGLANLMRGHDSAKVTPKTWWDNMKSGWK